MMDRTTLIAELRAQNISLQAVLENNRRLLSRIEADVVPVRPAFASPAVAPAAVARKDPDARPLKRGRKRDESKRRLVRETLQSGKSAHETSALLGVSVTHAYRVKREMEQAMLSHPAIQQPMTTVVGQQSPRPAAGQLIAEASPQVTAMRIEDYLEMHGPTAFSPLIRALDITPRGFNEAVPHLTKIEKIDGLWQVTPKIPPNQVWG